MQSDHLGLDLIRSSKGCEERGNGVIGPLLRVPLLETDLPLLSVTPWASDTPL